MMRVRHICKELQLNLKNDFFRLNESIYSSHEIELETYCFASVAHDVECNGQFFFSELIAISLNCSENLI
jgi:hypothetical protein